MFIRIDYYSIDPTHLHVSPPLGLQSQFEYLIEQSPDKLSLILGTSLL